MKVVIVIDKRLPPGLSANAAAALAFSVSPNLISCVGDSVPDASGSIHPGITNVPLPILASTAEGLAELRREAQGTIGVSCTDFSDIAQHSKNYAEYARELGAATTDRIHYLGVCIHGEDAAVRSLTGSLPLLGR